MKDVINFLQLLESNNNREWFTENKKLYEEARHHFETVLSSIIVGISVFDGSVGLPSAKESMFRIYRDVRFSKNKLPYKTNMGGFVSPGGRKAIKSGYYVHIEPGKSFLGGGIYMPDPEVLKKIRQEIYFNAGEFVKIITQRDFRKVFGELSREDMLKRPPKDFPADFPDIALLLYKSYVVGHSLTDAEVVAGDFTVKAIEIFKTMKPLHDFLNRAIEQ
ncbi:MAG: DUF2461 domain-containing protein [Lentimicrobium sp.]|jgi:uncharacterized protein (TIGR02453 family)|nr:DUF2461 domain-containing protein [Lentimicrobium sp.]